MNRARLWVSLLLVLAGGAAQQRQRLPPGTVTLKTNTIAGRNLELVNRSQKNHQFQIQLTTMVGIAVISREAAKDNHPGIRHRK